MKNYSVFDILGPVMIGPSSSHTAGAARLGKIARDIVGEDFTGVDFYLHGSFAMTYKGHGTDKALAAGILGMQTDDERLKDSLKIAEERGIDIKFIPTNLGDEHPNTVKMVFYKDGGSKTEITGSSIGGGNIIITNIDGEKIEFTGASPTILIKHVDKKGMISKVTSILALDGINIATMKVNRRARGEEASMIIEADNYIPDDVVNEIASMKNIIMVRAINPV